MNKTIIWVIVILVIILGAYLFPFDGGKQKSEEATEITKPVEQIEDNQSTSLIDENKETAVKEISMETGGFFFNPNKLTLKKDQPVKINIKNAGVHTFTIDELGVDAPLTGPSAVVEFTPTKSGTFEYYCAIPGHKERGQIGTVTVI